MTKQSSHCASSHASHHRSIYRSYINNDIAPTTGTIPLTDPSRDDVAGWIAVGKSGKTIANKHSFLAGCIVGALSFGTKIGSDRAVT
ncbi:hypothetical protein JDV09_09795 [Mycobacterium sp. Y57]|uniref:hypothetical protein n=1 Tax=Mycolicibacterium xanthum TaxID=2796469 RepID=UPI001C84AFDF|nr:hypothetical protein [Mycolicibacterium xanthum]MBX7432395.1 hypothetical protein [Mycolicibacterium xanthum]